MAPIQVLEEKEAETLTRPSSANPQTLQTERQVSGTRIAHYVRKNNSYDNNGLAIIWDNVPESQPLTEHLKTDSVNPVQMEQQDAINRLENLARTHKIGLNKNIGVQPKGMQFYTYPSIHQPHAYQIILKMTN